MSTMLESLNFEKFTKDINWEQRKSIQIYSILSYFSKFISFYDFYSQECYESFLYSIYLLWISENKLLSPEFLLLGFLKEAQSLKQILIEYGLTFEKVQNDLFNNTKNRNGTHIFFKNYENFFNLKKKSITKNSTFYTLSESSCILLNKVIENAFLRFKTPIVTPELFFLTLLESTENPMSLLIKKNLGNDVNFFTLKYKLTKLLYDKELSIKTVVPKSFRFYAYLLKTNLNFLELENIYLSNFKVAQLFFLRYHIFNEILKSNFEVLFIKDIYNLIKFSNNRKYR